MTAITSYKNPKIKEVRALKERKVREATGLFVVEGIRHVAEAVEAGAPVAYVCYAPDLLTSPYGRELVEKQRAAGVPCYSTAPDVFAKLSERDNPNGLLAVVRQNRTDLTQLTPANFSWGVALVAPQDPGNVGTILRTIDAVGASGLILLEHSVDPYYPEAVRASLGALFWLPIVQATFKDFAQWAAQHAYHVYGSSARGSVDYRTVQHYPRPALLLLGSEREGLKPEQLAVCAQVLRLPMQGRATSLNLAVAAGVLLYAML